MINQFKSFDLGLNIIPKEITFPIEFFYNNNLTLEDFKIFFIIDSHQKYYDYDDFREFKQHTGFTSNQIKKSIENLLNEGYISNKKFLENKELITVYQISIDYERHEENSQEYISKILYNKSLSQI